MKRYQEIEIQRHCKNQKAFMKKLEQKYPKFFEVWGQYIEYQFNQGNTLDISLEAGYILHTINEKDYYYVCLIALTEQQVITE